MAAIHITNFRAGWLYESATAAAPTTWSTIDTSQDLTFSSDTNVLIRVTADSPQYDSTAYLVEAVNSQLEHIISETIKLDVPTGNGTFRADFFELDTTLSTYGQVVSTHTVDQGHHRSRLLYEQQVEIERLAGGLLDYHGNVLRCVESGNTETKELEEGGILEGYDLTLTTNRKQWADLGIKPIVGATLTKGGKRYKIQQLLTNDASFELGLMKKQ